MITEKPKPHYRVLVINQDRFKKTNRTVLRKNRSFERWFQKRLILLGRITYTTNQRNYFIELKPKKKV